MTRTVLAAPDGPDGDYLEWLWSLPCAEVSPYTGQARGGDYLLDEAAGRSVGSLRHWSYTRPIQNHLVSFAILATLAVGGHHGTLSDSPNTDELNLVRAVAWLASATARRRRARISPQRLTSLAVLIAGRQRAAVCGEWQSHLAGETGAGLPPDRQVRVAAGFVLAAVRYRLQDLADLLWRPVDAALASRELSNLAALLPTLYVSVLFIRVGGLYGLAEHLEDVAVVWGAAYALIRTGRWWRGVKPPRRKPKRESE